MSDLEDDGFSEEAFKGLEEAGSGTPADPAVVTPPAGDDPTKKDDPKPKEGEEDANKNQPTNQPEGAPKPGEEKPTPSDSNKPTDPEEKPGDGKPTEPVTPPPATEAPAPLTKDDVSSVIRDVLNNERMSSKELETASKEVLEAYYPDGLSNVLVDEATGKELRTPQDVVDVVAATGGEISVEKAAQWLINEQAKLEQQVGEIRNQAQTIAETTVNFKRDSVAVLQKYEPLFKAYPVLQKKAFDLMMKQVKVDKDKGVILQAPDVMDLYDTYLEPYQLAYEHSTQQSATNPTPNPNEPPKPSAEDRMDEGGDGGQSPVDDPNDFAQQVTKELAKPL